MLPRNALGESLNATNVFQHRQHVQRSHGECGERLRLEGENWDTYSPFILKTTIEVWETSATPEPTAKLEPGGSNL